MLHISEPNIHIAMLATTILSLLQLAECYEDVTCMHASLTSENQNHVSSYAISWIRNEYSLNESTFAKYIIENLQL